MLQHWTAAGIDIERGDETAVVSALSFWDYSLVGSVPGSEAYKATGRCFSVASGRISYTYALKGVLAGRLSTLRMHICLKDVAGVKLW